MEVASPLAVSLFSSVAAGTLCAMASMDLATRWLWFRIALSLEAPSQGDLFSCCLFA
jgi:hypothetical protein